MKHTEPAENDTEPTQPTQPVQTSLLAPPTPPSVLASIASETVSALASQMERVGMNPAEWFRIATMPTRKDR